MSQAAPSSAALPERDPYEIRHRIDLGDIHMTKDRSNTARFWIGNDDNAYRWSWPTDRGGEHWQSFAEELARALAVIDGRFEVRRLGP